MADGTYKVSAKDAHAWPEVYFSGLGWIEFEPTTSQDVIYRPSGEERVAQDDDYLFWRQERLEQLGLEDSLIPDQQQPPIPFGPATDESAVSTPQAKWLWVIILVAATFGLVVLLLRLEQKYAITHKIPRAIKNILVRYHLNTPQWLDYWVRWSEVTAVERAFHAVNQALRWLGKPQPQDVTALERAALLKELIPASAEAIETLVAAHEQTLYTPRPASPATAIRAAWTIRYQALYALFRRF